MASERLSSLVKLAWQAFDDAAKIPSRVNPAAPILFFGDCDSYLASPVRILTVGLNPSLHEFPIEDPYKRFPLLADQDVRAPAQYVAAMSRYFRVEPYRRWFNSLEPILNGAGSSYYPQRASSTALHTDLGSPVATDPAWGSLPKNEKNELKRIGYNLWKQLITELQPQIVLVSVERTYIDRSEFGPLASWHVIHTFGYKRDGTPRDDPYEIRAQRFPIGGQKSLFVFGQGAQTPFGTLATPFKHETGEIALRAFKGAVANHDK